MVSYRTPGVYVEEISTLPPSVAEVATAVPAFIGYTKTGPAETADPLVKRITSMLEFMTAFGSASPAMFTVTTPSDSTGALAVEGPTNIHKFSLYYALSHYFKNGGGPCYVVSVGNYASTPNKNTFTKGIQALEKEDEPTLIVLTDAACLLSSTNYYELCSEALAQCRKLGDRFTIIDVINESTADDKDWEIFRNDHSLSINLNYGAAYIPYLQTSINYVYSEDDVVIAESADSPTAQKIWSKDFGVVNGLSVNYGGPNLTPTVKIVGAGDTIEFEVDQGKLTITGVAEKTAENIVTAWNTWKQDSSSDTGRFDITKSGDGSAAFSTKDGTSILAPLPEGGGETTGTLATIKGDQTALYNKAKATLADQQVVLPPSAAMAGIYARVDREQGVWKAPANVGVMAVLGPVAKITDDEQDRLNVDPTAGKSINAIRAFTGKGTLVWGARTLAGNDNEWRYVSVRRLFITIEESTKKASAFAVFEANDQTSWLKVKAMIESYLYGLWEQGALAGSKPDAAYYVNVGLGTTMTPQDVLEGRMIVEIGIAAVRPAEFIILRFSHKLQTA